jgi:hypothetical protein
MNIPGIVRLRSIDAPYNTEDYKINKNELIVINNEDGSKMVLLGTADK